MINKRLSYRKGNLFLLDTTRKFLNKRGDYFFIFTKSGEKAAIWNKNLKLL